MSPSQNTTNTNNNNNNNIPSTSPSHPPSLPQVTKSSSIDDMIMVPNEDDDEEAAVLAAEASTDVDPVRERTDVKASGDKVHLNKSHVLRDEHPTASLTPLDEFAPLDEIFFSLIPSTWFRCSTALEVITKFNHRNLPHSMLIMKRDKFPKAISKLVPHKKNAKKEVPIIVQNFHIYLYCWHFMRNIGASSFPDRIPRMSHVYVDMQLLWNEVMKKYGYLNVCNAEGIYGWLGIFKRMPNYSVTITNYTSRLKDYYNKYLLEFENANGYYNVKRRMFRFEVPQQKEPLEVEWEYYFEDPVIRDLTLTPSKMDTSQIEVDRFTLTLNIDLDVEGKEESLKKFPDDTKTIFAGDVFYSYPKESLVLCHTPARDQEIVFKRFEPYFLVGRLNTEVWEKLDLLRTNYLKSIVDGEIRVSIEVLPNPVVEELAVPATDDTTTARPKDKPPRILKWGETGRTGRRRFKDKRPSKPLAPNARVTVTDMKSNAVRTPPSLSSLGANGGFSLSGMGGNATKVGSGGHPLTDTGSEPDLTDMLNIPSSSPPHPAPQLPAAALGRQPTSTANVLSAPAHPASSGTNNSEVASTTNGGGQRKSKRKSRSSNASSTSGGSEDTSGRKRKKRKVDASVPTMPHPSTLSDQDYVSTPTPTRTNDPDFLPPADEAYSSGTTSRSNMNGHSLSANPQPHHNVPLYGDVHLTPGTSISRMATSIVRKSANPTKSTAVQTNFSFGIEGPMCAIRYKLSGSSDSQFRFISHKIGNKNAEVLIDKAKLLEILSQDQVPVQKLREIRHFYNGPNPEISGWMLVNEDFRYCIPKHSDMVMQPHLTLKLSFRGLDDE